MPNEIQIGVSQKEGSERWNGNVEALVQYSVSEYLRLVRI